MSSQQPVSRAHGGEAGREDLRLKQIVETLTLASAMKMALPRLLPAAPTALGVGLVVGSDGVMMGTQMVVSAEWVEMMRRLVQAGVVSASRRRRRRADSCRPGDAVAVATRTCRRACAMRWARDPRCAACDRQAKRGLAWPSRRGTTSYRREYREWFEQRGFTGDMSIDQFCVKMEQASHEAIHGGGDWQWVAHGQANGTG